LIEREREGFVVTYLSALAILLDRADNYVRFGTSCDELGEPSTELLVRMKKNVVRSFSRASVVPLQKATTHLLFQHTADLLRAIK
jgi:hypothetical protein